MWIYFSIREISFERYVYNDGTELMTESLIEGALVSQNKEQYDDDQHDE